MIFPLAELICRVLFFQVMCWPSEVNNKYKFFQSQCNIFLDFFSFTDLKWLTEGSGFLKLPEAEEEIISFIFQKV